MTTKVRIDLDKAAIHKLLHGRPGAVNKVMGGFAGLATETVRSVSDQRITHRTGDYRRSIKATLTKPDQLEVVADVEYATILELGSKPHPITGSGMLRFEISGEVLFRKTVQHPGTKAYHILRDGVDEAGKHLNRLAAR